MVMFIKRIESLLYLNNRKYKYKDQWIDVAMKEISSDRVGRNKQLFEREKNLPRYINHVNIIKYYGSGDYQDKNHPEDDTKRMYFLVMELADHSLKDYIYPPKPNCQLTKKQKYSIIKQIADGLRYLHSLSILHRDIKCNNILIMKDKNNNLIPKIADFGLAKNMDVSGSGTNTRVSTPL